MRVSVISRPQIDWAAIDQFLNDEGTTWQRTTGALPSEELVEFAGRVCYMSFGTAQSPRSNPEYLANLLRMGHESVLEHAVWTFMVSGISRAFTHQLVRHRVGFSFSQLSQQYHDETEAEFVKPEHLERYPAAAKEWADAIASSRNAYRKILGILQTEEFNQSLSHRELTRAIRSAARSVLPNATATKLVMTANARAIRYFLKVRGTIPGDIEMRMVAAEVLEQVKSDAPAMFLDFRIDELEDGPIVVHSEIS